MVISFAVLALYKQTNKTKKLVHFMVKFRGKNLLRVM